MADLTQSGMRPMHDIQASYMAQVSRRPMGEDPCHGSRIDRFTTGAHLAQPGEGGRGALGDSPERNDRFGEVVETGDTEPKDNEAEIGTPGGGDVVSGAGVEATGRASPHCVVMPRG